jgi:beta-galactosidase
VGEYGAHGGEWRSAVLTLNTVVQNEGKQAESAKVSWQILDAAGKTVATAEAAAQSIDADGSAKFTATAKLTNPALWSVDAPNLYSAIVTVEAGGKGS